MNAAKLLDVVHRRSRASHRAPILAAVAVIAFFLAQTGVAVAQEFVQDNFGEVAPNKPVLTWSQVSSVASGEHKAVLGMLTGEPMDNAAFDKFFNGIVFPLFTRYEDIKLGTRIYPALVKSPSVKPPSEMRASLKSDYLTKATNSNAHAKLNDLTLTYMEKIAAGNYHPVCRYNAALAIGDLNESEPIGPPYKAALPKLLKFAGDAKAMTQVRIPALRGLLRHATSGIDQQSRPQVVRAMLDILKQPVPTDENARIEHDWIGSRAVDILAALGDTPPGRDVQNGLMQAINDAAGSLPVRCAAAGALAKVKLNPQGVDVAALAKTMGKLAVEDAKQEVATAAVQHAAIPVEQIKDRLSQIRAGLDAVSAATTDATRQQFVKQLSAQIDALSGVCKPAPMTLGSQSGGNGPVVPVDTQEKLGKIITAASESLENALLHGEGAAPAAGKQGPAGAAADSPLGAAPVRVGNSWSG